MASEAPSTSGAAHLVSGLSAGSSHSIALLDDGTVLTWGRGEDGQLGHGGAAAEEEPRAVYGLLNRGVSAVVCGAEYSVAVSGQEKQVYSWGWGDFGRLGHGDVNDVFVPRPISFFTGKRVTQVACGDTHTLVITDGGQLYSFGRNQNGQLGLGHTHDQTTPQLVESLQGETIVSVAGGAEHSVACSTSGQVWGWGWGRYGNLGNGLQEDRLTPCPTIGLEGIHVVQVGCGWRHSVAVTDRGQLYTFGWSKYGQLGHNDNVDRSTPTLVAALQDKVVVAVAGGWRHTMAADLSGTLYGWGWNRFGQLGLGDIEDRNVPTPIPELSGVRTRLLACGWRHTLAVTQTGQVYVWGRGTNGQLGHGVEEDRCTPMLLECLSAGHMDLAALRATAAPSGEYVSPEDRYAVVPGSMGDGNGQADDGVPTVPDAFACAVTKRARTDNSNSAAT